MEANSRFSKTKRMVWHEEFFYLNFQQNLKHSLLDVFSFPAFRHIRSLGFFSFLWSRDLDQQQLLLLSSSSGLFPRPSPVPPLFSSSSPLPLLSSSSPPLRVISVMPLDLVTL